MHDRSKWLIIHGADPEKWAKRYDIEPLSHPCYHCGVVQTTSIPFAAGTLRGLVALAHECHGVVRNPPYCIVGTMGGGLSELFAPPKPTHRSAGVQRSYQPKSEPKRGPRHCKYKHCSNPSTHVGTIDGICVTTGCKWHMAKWAREGARHTTQSPLSAG